MIRIVGVRFKNVGKIYFFDPGELDIKLNDGVIVETTRGVEFGTIVLDPREIDESDAVLPVKKVIRIATEEDRARLAQNEQKEKSAFETAAGKIKNHGLEMKLINVEYTFDGNKILFYFTAEGRVDFRELVKDLATVFRTRIELRQIGVRDEAKILGGLGICGRGLCCATLLDEFQPVSIKMAKEQGLSLNPTKISGSCGRLMCCLKFEQDSYEMLSREAPRVGAVVKTPSGNGVVESVSLLKEHVVVRLKTNAEDALLQFPFGDVRLLKDVKRELKEDRADPPELSMLED